MSTIINNATTLKEFVDYGSAIDIVLPIMTEKIVDAIIMALNFKPKSMR